MIKINVGNDRKWLTVVRWGVVWWRWRVECAQGVRVVGGGMRGGGGEG